LAALTRIAEPLGVPEAMEMVRTLVRGHETVVKTIREVLPLAQSASDESSISLLTDRLLIHEKTAWMLRSLIG
ncbi:MAG TPA: ferritin-like domain-containing protein, partial [Myxococcota bacterium]|nr:ferritin-like domain-containing protein [Myxococcota bacterium]